MLSSRSIQQVATSRDRLYAFRIHGEVSREDMTAMAQAVNDIFDSHEEKVDLLMIFDRYEGSEAGATLSWESLKSRFRSLANIGRYVVVGTPEQAEDMIDFMGNFIPVEAETFDEEISAWRSLDAEAVAP